MWAERGENLEEARELVQQAVALEPNNGAYVDSLGWAHYQLGDLDEAKRYLERAAELIPDDAVIFEHLGDVYLELGDASKAREVYEKALELGSENAGEVESKLRSLSEGL